MDLFEAYEDEFVEQTGVIKNKLQNLQKEGTGISFLKCAGELAFIFFFWKTQDLSNKSEVFQELNANLKEAENLVRSIYQQ